MDQDRPAIRRRLLQWFDRHQRSLPWRRCAAGSTRPDPYHVLVSEAMLQQTQVATVIPYFARFLTLFPTISHLADASEQQVLRSWQGLGYYSRARHLHATAKSIVSERGGQIPSNVLELVMLPGIGRYTAGAIASIAFDQRAPILDGNVVRVLCRLCCIEEDPRQTSAKARLWGLAEEILPRRRVGDFNSALMDLGATVCTPSAPKCEVCPLRAMCGAHDAGKVGDIPARAPAKHRPLLRRWTFCLRRGDRWLIERRPSTGRWAGMWQFITVAAGGGRPTPARVRAVAGVGIEQLRSLGTVEHGLTHRRYRIEAFAGEARGAPAGADDRAWVTLEGLADYPLPKPHLRIAELLKELLKASNGHRRLHV